MIELNDCPQILTPHALATPIRVHRSTVDRWRREDTGPNFFRDDKGRAAYRKADVERWLRANSYVKRGEKLYPEAVA